MIRRSSDTPLCDVVMDVFMDLHRRRQAVQAAGVLAVVPAVAVGGGGAVDAFLHIDQSICRCVETIVASECNVRRLTHEASMFDKVLKLVSEMYMNISKLMPFKPTTQAI